MKIKRIDSPNFSSREGTDVDMIVIHCASLPEGEYGTGYISDLFLNRLDLDAHPSFKSLKGLKVSAHYLIERTGEVIEYVDCDQKAWHAGVSTYQGTENCNMFSIGIELEGDVLSAYEDAQYDALHELIKVLIEKYPLITEKRIVRHSDISPERKDDPGPHFDMERVKGRAFI